MTMLTCARLNNTLDSRRRLDSDQTRRSPGHRAPVDFRSPNELTVKIVEARLGSEVPGK